GGHVSRGLPSGRPPPAERGTDLRVEPLRIGRLRRPPPHGGGTPVARRADGPPRGRAGFPPPHYRALHALPEHGLRLPGGSPRGVADVSTRPARSVHGPSGALPPGAGGAPTRPPPLDGQPPARHRRCRYRGLPAGRGHPARLRLRRAGPRDLRAQRAGADPLPPEPSPCARGAGLSDHREDARASQRRPIRRAERRPSAWPWRSPAPAPRRWSWPDL